MTRLRLPEWRDASDWPPPARFAAAALLAFALAALDYGLHLSGRLDQLAASRARTERARDELAAARRDQARLPALKRETAALARRVAADGASLAVLLRGLRQLAARHGLSTGALLPAAPDGDGDRAPLRLEATFHGEFPAIVDFWQALSTLPPAIGCDAFTLAADDDWPRLTLTTRWRLQRQAA
jgi:Tfp pilus assembly protein PilO